MDVVGELRGLLTPAQVLGPGEDLSRYETDWRYQPGRAACVVRPRTAAEVSAVLAWADGNRVRLVAQGAATGLVQASVPDASGEMGVLSLELVRELFALDPVDATLAVGAGWTLDEVNDRVAEHSLTLPIDVGSNPTVGGMVATNTGGSRMLRYGDVRRRLLGVEIVLADGTVVSDLGGLRKDNTGLGVAAFVTGTSGAFGVVTAAVFALDRRPADVAAALAVPTSDEAALALLLAAEAEAGEWLTAFEAMSAPAVTIARRHTPGLHWPLRVEAPGEAPVLLVELASTALASGVEDRLVALLAGASERGELVDAVVGRPEPLWAVRHAITPALPHEGIVTGMDVSVRRSRLPALRADARALVAELEPDVVLADFGHYGDGGLHMNQVWPHAMGVPSADRLEALKEALFDLVVVRHGGSFSAEHGIGPLNRAAYERFVPPARRRLAGALQDLLDPNHTLGRVDLR